MNIAKTAPPEAQLYRVPEAARVLALSVSTVWGLIYGGKIRAVRLRTSVRIPRAEVDRILCEGVAQ